MKGILKSLYETSIITLKPKLNKDSTEKNYRSVFLMNTDTTILNKILANQIQQYIGRIIYHSQMGLTPEMQEWFSIHRSNNRIHHTNKTKNKNHKILSIDLGKAFDEIRHPFMVKLSTKWVQSVHISAYIIFNHEKLKAFLLRSGTRQGCPLLALLFNMILLINVLECIQYMVDSLIFTITGLVTNNMVNC